MAQTPEISPSEDDAVFVRRALAGDQAAYEMLVEKYQRAAVGFAYGVTGERSAAEDAAQEGFVRAFQALGQLDKPGRFLSWLRTIVRNSAMDIMRRRQRTVSLDELAETGFDPESLRTGTPGDALAEEERVGAMLKILDGLRPDYREIVMLRYGEEMSYRAIAELLDMKVSAVGEKLSRVRNLLREKARRAGVLPKSRSDGKKE